MVEAMVFPAVLCGCDSWTIKKFSSVQFSSVQFSCSVVSDSLLPMNRSMPGLHVHHQLPESTQTHVHGVGNAIQQSYPLLSPFPPALNLSLHQGLFQTLQNRWPKYWSFSFNISPCNEYPGLVSFRMGSLDLLSDQGTLKNVLQHHSSKASILLCSAFFIVPLSVRVTQLVDGRVDTPKSTGLVLGLERFQRYSPFHLLAV